MRYLWTLLMFVTTHCHSLCLVNCPHSRLVWRIPNFMTALMVLLTHHSLTLYVIVKIHNHILQHWLPPRPLVKDCGELSRMYSSSWVYSEGGTAARVSCFSAVALVDGVKHSNRSFVMVGGDLEIRIHDQIQCWLRRLNVLLLFQRQQDPKLKNGEDSEEVE